MKKTQTFGFVLCLTCAPLLLDPGGLVHAAPITTITGTIPSFTLTSPSPFGGVALALLAIPAASATANLDGLGPFATTFGPLNMLRTPIVGPPGFTSFAVGPALTIGDVKIILGLPGGSVEFDFNGSLTARVPTNPALFNTLTMTGTEVVDSSRTSALDFSAFNPGDVTLSFETTAGTDLAAVIINGGTVMGTGSFVEHAAGVGGVPEPSSLLILVTGLVAIASAVGSRRKWA